MRFEGSLNVDLNEITMNLVPYPRMHYLLSSLSPFASLKPSLTANASRRLTVCYTIFECWYSFFYVYWFQSGSSTFTTHFI